MTATATKVQDGPFSDGLFTENATLYALSEPFEHQGRSFDHVIVSSVGKDDWGPDETIALPANEAGSAFTAYPFPYMEEGTTDKTLALNTLGYEVLEPVPAVEN